MSASSTPDYDLIVAGGGPAGSSVSNLVAHQGYRVLLLERDPEPTFRVGESLMPACYWLFQRLGVLETMKKSSFPVKGSVQFFTGDGRGSTPFYFEDHDPDESSWTWQVLRSDFDQMLLDQAANRGVEVRRGCSVRRYLEEDGRIVGVRYADGGGRTEELSSRIVVDATGQRASLARQLNLLIPDHRLRHAAYFTHFEGARRDTGKDAGATLILHTIDHQTWFWFIPLPEDRVSVGVVGPVDYFVREGRGDPQKVFDGQLEHCPALISRLDGARQVLSMHVVKDYSYGVEAMAGDGWVLVGDAGGFIDPIYSTGVFLALKSGEMAADSICNALAQPEIDIKLLGAFEADFRLGVDAMRKLVYAFYDPDFSFAKFLARYPECKGQLIDLLMGNVFRKPIDELLQNLEESFPSIPEVRNSENST